MISKKLQPFGTTIFSEMTQLAQEHDAINLSQGCPDFNGPEEVIEAAVKALRSGDNQYARSMGHPKLVEAVARHQKAFYGIELDPFKEITVFSGATEGIASSLLGLLNPGDEVVLFEPFFDSYPACIAMAGAVPKYCTLRFPDFAVDESKLASLFTDKTRLLLLNTPHNPTGKVFTHDELSMIAELCRRYDVIAVTDEVYEHLVFGGNKHIPLSTFPGMRERTLSLSSSGKTFSFTGWKIGWATGPASLIAAAQAAHQFVTFATATPLQAAMAYALDTLGESFYNTFLQEYAERRSFLLSALDAAGFKTAPPGGTYFILADFSAIHKGDDQAFVRDLIRTHHVAAIPPSVFYHDDLDEGRRLVRFAFCKRMDTLKAAGERLGRMKS
ncbi:MAG: aminotransferase class I/II-fold pyridoxal phosphate-dependent enzyme [Planctomycetota bacterium]